MLPHGALGRMLPRSLAGGRKLFTSTRCHSSAMEIPGPRMYPLVGSLPDLIKDKDKDIMVYFKKLCDRFGPVVRVKFPLQPLTVLINCPKDVAEVYRLTSPNPVRLGLQSFKKARYLDRYFENKAGLTAEHGEEWYRLRQNVQGTVMKPSNVMQYLSSMDEVTQDLLNRISKERNENGEATTDIIELLNKWSLESVCLFSFNGRLGALDPNLTEDSEEMKCLRAANKLIRSVLECEVSSLYKLYPTKEFKTMQASLKILTEVCDRRLREFKAGIDQRNLQDPDRDLNMLEELLLNPNLSHKDVVTFMIDLIPGGTETTHSSTLVLLYLLATHPEVQAKVQEEVDRVMGADPGPITRKQYAQLSYIKATLRESHRVLPPTLGVSRVLQDDIELRGYTVRKGSNCLLLSALSGLDPSEFPRPDEFVPERWLRHRPEGPINPYASLPFSLGLRMCIGRRIAEQEICVLVARTLQRFNLGWNGGELRREFRWMFRPLGPFPITLTEREAK